MANEISYSGQAGLSGVYAVMRNIAGQVYNRSTNAFENWVTANLANYKITLTENGDGGGDYLGDFDPDSDGIVAGNYKVEVFDSSDKKVGQGWIYWDGSAEMDTSTLDALIDTVKAETALIVEDTDELQTALTDGGRLDLLIDAIKTVTDNLPNSGALTDIATVLTFVKNISEGDWSIDTTTTPWQAVCKIKSTDTELVRKDLKDASGTNITSIAQLIGQLTEPA